jgi:NADH-quinone oxidoreductase subunit H
MSAIIVLLFIGGWLPLLNIFFFKNIYTSFWFSIKLLLVMFLFVWVRATLPRYRYDQLMMLGWKVILPLSLSFSFLSIFFFLLFI